MSIREIKQYVNGEKRTARLRDYLVYKGEPEQVAKDFNEYTETGVYSWSIVADILKDCLNRPTDVFGTLEVKNDKTGIIYHRYEAVDSKVYLRSCIQEEWTKWELEGSGTVFEDMEGTKSTRNLKLIETDFDEVPVIKVSPNMGITIVKE